MIERRSDVLAIAWTVALTPKFLTLRWEDRAPTVWIVATGVGVVGMDIYAVRRSCTAEESVAANWPIAAEESVVTGLMIAAKESVAIGTVVAAEEAVAAGSMIALARWRMGYRTGSTIGRRKTKGFAERSAVALAVWHCDCAGCPIDERWLTADIAASCERAMACGSVGWRVV